MAGYDGKRSKRSIRRMCTGSGNAPGGFVAWALQHGAVSRFEATMSKITWRAPDPWQPLLKGGC
jgi:hypothetical protein